jgi:hypothetical protein
MHKRWQVMAGLATGLAILGGGVLSASAHTGQPVSASNPSSVITSVRSAGLDLLSSLGIGDDESSASPGKIDDGKALLPQAKITLDEAIQAAQASHSGTLGEVDLEYYDGRLVFNVDLGDQDVKVDAENGNVLGSAVD